MKTNSKSKVIKNKRVKGKVSKSKKVLKKGNFFQNHKKITIISFVSIFLILILLLIIINVINKNSLEKVVITINEDKYTKSDFNIYFYSSKYDYFGKEANNISDDNMKVIVDEENKTTLGEYLKEKTLSEIKTASAIKEYAKENNIELDDKDKKELKQEKEKYIKSIGGKDKFNSFLKNNDTNEKSYDMMAETDKLYNKIIEKLYSEGKRKDLTEEELLKAKENYGTEYFKIEQVILTVIDTETKKSLSDTTINQKNTLANTIHDLSVNGEDFESLVSKYSEAAVDKEPPYYEYYKKGELLTELEDAIVKLGNNEISEVIQTKYAIHIIKRLELDDSKYSEYLDELREQKALKDLKDTLDTLKIIYRDAYKEIKY